MSKTETTASELADKLDAYLGCLEIASEAATELRRLEGVDWENKNLRVDYKIVRDKFLEDEARIAELEKPYCQLLGAFAKIGICEPIEGFVESPHALIRCVNELQARIAELEKENAELQNESESDFNSCENQLAEKDKRIAELEAALKSRVLHWCGPTIHYRCDICCSSLADKDNIAHKSYCILAKGLTDDQD